MLFYKEKVFQFQQIYCKMWMKKMVNEGNQVHNFISSSGSDFLTSYGFGSTSQKSYGSYCSGSTTLQKSPPPPISMLLALVVSISLLSTIP